MYKNALMNMMTKIEEERKKMWKTSDNPHIKCTEKFT